MGFSQEYQVAGVDQFYLKTSESYTNPHQHIVQSLVSTYCSNHSSIIDLACGGGEVSLILPPSCFVLGIDPFTSNLYKKKTGKECLTLSFEQIAIQGLSVKADAIVCSFALHLAEQSYLHMLLWHLAQSTNHLYVISPTKRPVIDHSSWHLEKTLTEQRVHFRHYSSRKQCE